MNSVFSCLVTKVNFLSNDTSLVIKKSDVNVQRNPSMFQ